MFVISINLFPDKSDYLVLYLQEVNRYHRGKSLPLNKTMSNTATFERNVMQPDVEKVRIGSLRGVSLPEIWRVETEKFSTWLAEHLDILAEHLGFKTLSFKRVGRGIEGSLFSADVMALDNQSRTVIIETQLERADHDHIGKVLTYARTLRAGVVIWISTDPLAEHEKIVDWLNRSDNRIDFYLVKVDAVKIDDSAIAPRFTTVISPDPELKKLTPAQNVNFRIRFLLAMKSKRATLLKRVAIAILALGAISFLTIYQAYYRATKPPESRPLAFLEQERPSDKKIVVAIGDNITHGQASYNYIDLLSRQLDDYEYHFVNAGMNSELAYNALQRIEEVILCKPDYVTILIGANDIRASWDEQHRDWAVRVMDLPEMPTKENYQKNIRKIVQRLKKDTQAKVALLSPPPIGQDPSHQLFIKAKEYSDLVRDVAQQERVFYLPLNENMSRYLQRARPKQNIDYPKNLQEELLLIYGSVFRLYVTGESLDEQAKRRGLLLSSDLLHLNSRGAGMVANLIEDFLRRANYSPPKPKNNRNIKVASSR